MEMVNMLHDRFVDTGASYKALLAIRDMYEADIISDLEYSWLLAKCSGYRWDAYRNCVVDARNSWMPVGYLNRNQ